MAFRLNNSLEWLTELRKSLYFHLHLSEWIQPKSSQMEEIHRTKWDWILWHTSHVSSQDKAVFYNLEAPQNSLFNIFLLIM
jgi:hypothetical protein